MFGAKNKYSELKEEYDRMSDTKILEQAQLLGSGSFLRAVESMIIGEKVTAAYAVQTTRDELESTFSSLNDPSIKDRIYNVSRVSNLLLEILGEDENRIDLGEEPVILAAETLSPAELMEMDKVKLLGIVTRSGSATSHAAILAKNMDIPCVTPAGGLGAHIDAGRFLPHIPQEDYPAGALAAAFFIASGVRGMERGTLSSVRDENGKDILADVELLRLAFPRRVFTLSQVKYVADRMKWLYDNRDLIGGLEFVEEPPVLRFFMGKLRAKSDWPEKLAAKYRRDFGESL